MIAIIKYSGGNTASVANALESFGYEYIVTDNPDEILKANKVIFPGQGRAGSTMRSLNRKDLDKTLQQIKQPFLGICLGMQLLFSFSEEDNTKCLNIIKGKVKRFTEKNLKKPQIGWNNLIQRRKSPLFRNVPDNAYVYFVNSYFVNVDAKLTLADYKYGNVRPAAMVRKDNFYGVQFHPEKSGKVGRQILKNFLEL